MSWRKKKPSRRGNRSNALQRGHACALVRGLASEAPIIELLEERHMLALVVSGDVFTVSQVNTVDNTTPHIAADAQGNFVVVWQQSATDIRARLFDATGTPLGNEFQVNTPAPGFKASTPEVAMSRTGGFVVTYTTLGDSLQEEVYAKRFDALGNALGGEFHVNSFTTYRQTNPSVAMDDAGDFVIVWQSGDDSISLPTQDGKYWGVYGQRFDASGVPDGSEFLINQTTIGTETSPRVATRPDGGFAVVWSESLTGAGGSRVLLRNYDAAGDATSGELSIGASSALSDPAIAIGRDGNTFVTFSQGTFLYAQWFTPEGLGMTGSVQQPAGRYNARLSVNDAGDFLAASMDNPNGPLKAQVYSYAGTPQGAGVKPFTPFGSFDRPDAFLSDQGDAFMVWSVRLNGPSKWIINAQRFINDSPLQVKTVSSATRDVIVAGTPARDQVTAFTVTFSRPVSTAGGESGANSVLNPANWQLLKDGQDYSSNITGITYASNRAQLALRDPLRGGPYELRIQDDVVDLAGQSLDGNGDKSPGGDYVLPFSIQTVFGFGLETQISDLSIGGNPGLYSIAQMQPDGAFGAAWTDYGAPFRPIRRFDTAGLPAGPFEASGGTTSPPTYAFMELDPFGTMVVTSNETGNLHPSKITARRYGPDGPLGDWFAVNDDNSDVRYGGWIANDAQGNFVIAWASKNQDGDSYGIYAQRYDSGGNRIGGNFRANTTTAGSQQDARVGMDQAGNFIIAWTSVGQDGSGGGVFAQRFATDGSTVGNEFQINTLAPGNQFGILVAMDANGGALFVWQNENEFGAGSNGIRARHYDALGNAGPEIRLNSSVGQEAIPSVAMNPAGDTIVVWERGYESGSAGSIRGQLLDANGQLVGGEFRVSSLAGELINPWVSMDEAGNAVVTWTNESFSKAIVMKRIALDQPAVIDLNGMQLGTDVALPVVDYDGFNAIQSPNMFVDALSYDHLESGTVAVTDYLAGDLLIADTSGTQIVASYADGVLTLTGLDSPDHYQQVLRSVRFSTTAERPPGSVLDIAFSVNDGLHESLPAHATLAFSSTVAGRHVFYNQSAFDGNDASIDFAADELARAPDKTAYLPGDPKAVAYNITNYTRGINGVMVDLAGGGTHASITAADFVFKVGKDNVPASWTAAPAPASIAVSLGGGVGGSDRVEITWPASSIVNEWLEIQVLATSRTGLASTDVFFWGSKVGDSGSGTLDANNFVTNSTDAAQVFATLTPAGGAGFANVRDYNRDKTVNSTDAAIVFATLGKLNRLEIGAIEILTLASGSAAVVDDSADTGADAGISSALASIYRGSFASTDSSITTTADSVVQCHDDQWLTSGHSVALVKYLAEVSPESEESPVEVDSVDVTLNLDKELHDSLLGDLARS